MGSNNSIRCNLKKKIYVDCREERGFQEIFFKVFPCTLFEFFWLFLISFKLKFIRISYFGVLDFTILVM